VRGPKAEGIESVLNRGCRPDGQNVLHKGGVKKRRVVEESNQRVQRSSKPNLRDREKSGKLVSRGSMRMYFQKRKKRG